MPGRVTPNGQKIKELRKALGIKQDEDFARRAGVSLRKYSDIENKNSPITDAKLNNIASALKVPVDDLVLPDGARGAQKQAGSVAQVFELQRQTSAAKILETKYSHVIEYEILVDLQTPQAAQVEELLILIEYSWRSYFGDFLDASDRTYSREDNETPDIMRGARFPEVHLRGRVQELVALLEDKGIGVFMGSHPYRYFKNYDLTEPVQTQVITWFKFASAKNSSITRPYSIGHVFDETTQQWVSDRSEGPDRMPF